MKSTTIGNIAVLAGLAILGALQSDESAFGVYGPFVGAIAALGINILSKYAPAAVAFIKAQIAIEEK